MVYEEDFAINTELKFSFLTDHAEAIYKAVENKVIME